MRWTSIRRALSSLAVSLILIPACSPTPTTPVAPVRSPERAPRPTSHVNLDRPERILPQGGAEPFGPLPPAVPPAGGAPPGPLAPPPPVNPRFVAFTATSFCSGNLFLYDDAIKDVIILNGAVAGLVPIFPEFKPFLLGGLEPTFYGPSCILFEFAGHIFSYDMLTLERVELACDGLPFGSHPRIANGLLVYINCNGNVVVRALLGPALGVPRVIGPLAAEAAVQGGVFFPGLPFFAPTCDLDISADGRWIVASINGKLYLYDMASLHLAQLLPLDGPALGIFPGSIAHVAISPDGRLIAFTTCAGVGERLLVLDRLTGLIEPISDPSLGVVGSWVCIANPRFFGSWLYFEVGTALGVRVWRYDLDSHLLGGLAVLNSALGSPGTDVLISNPAL